MKFQKNMRWIQINTGVQLVHNQLIDGNKYSRHSQHLRDGSQKGKVNEENKQNWTHRTQNTKHNQSH